MNLEKISFSKVLLEDVNQNALFDDGDRVAIDTNNNRLIDKGDTVLTVGKNDADIHALLAMRSDYRWPASLPFKNVGSYLVFLENLEQQYALGNYYNAFDYIVKNMPMFGEYFSPFMLDGRLTGMDVSPFEWHFYCALYSASSAAERCDVGEFNTYAGLLKIDSDKIKNAKVLAMVDRLQIDEKRCGQLTSK